MLVRQTSVKYPDMVSNMKKPEINISKTMSDMIRLINQELAFHSAPIEQAYNILSQHDHTKYPRQDICPCLRI